MNTSLNLIPGPDPGACPNCGGWRRAGMSHDCDAERARLAEFVESLSAARARAVRDDPGPVPDGET